MGNVTSTALDNVMNKIAFKPPFPATYAHNLFGKVSYTHTISGQKIAFAIVKPDPISKFPTNEEKLEYNEDSIAIMSHGNAVDIGQIVAMMRKIQFVLMKRAEISAHRPKSMTHRRPRLSTSRLPGCGSQW